MHSSDWMMHFRGVVARRELGELIELLTGTPWPPDALQIIGEALIPAMRQRLDGCQELARRCVEALRTRNWDGDRELAQELTDSHDEGDAELHPLPVDVEDLADILEGDALHSRGGINLKTGQVWPMELFDAEGLAVDELEDFEDWLWVDGQGSHEGFMDMVTFIDTVKQPECADRLQTAIEGKGAFRRFRNVLDRWPDESERWYRFSDDRRRGRARLWLRRAGYRPEARSD